LKKVLIVGGGSAAWMTASYLNAALNMNGQQRISITVVESPTVGRIGVGEATVPSIRNTLNKIGVEEVAFMKAADATFKSGIRFDGWLGEGGPGYFHPFDRRASDLSDGMAAQWVASARNQPWANMVSALAPLSAEGYAPKTLDWPSYGSTFPYAYHMDAEKFADFLSEFSTARGVTHIRDDVVNVDLCERGNVTAVRLKSGDSVTADLFIDCTGFAGVLIEKALGVDWVDFSPWLLCDRAIAMRVPFDVHFPGRIKPFTTAKALNSGWAWDISLIDRRGRGYVYSSAYIDDETAEAELRADEGGYSKECDARRLRFRVGHRREFWSKNVIAIGLSSGFIEPLESTALYTVEFAVAALCDYFPLNDCDLNDLRNRYNAVNEALFDEILDFINLHYCLSQRNDTEFWREATSKNRMTAAIASRLDLWRRKPPSHLDFDRPMQLFSQQSYEYILYGMDFGEAAAAMADGPSLKISEQMEKIIRMSRQKFPKHEEWLAKKLGMTKFLRYPVH
jgi:tryptophan 7-halogenase